MLQNLKELHDKNNLPNLLLYGNNLIGKKTLLEQLLLYIYQNYKNIENNTLILNCSLGKGNIKFIRDNLRFFANTIIHKNITNFKSIVLLNADSLTLDAQSALRRSIEIYNNTRFFIVTANKSKIIRPILSRFCEIFCNINNLNIIYKSLAVNNSNNNKCNNKLAIIIKNLRMEILNYFVYNIVCHFFFRFKFHWFNHKILINKSNFVSRLPKTSSQIVK